MEKIISRIIGELTSDEHDMYIYYGKPIKTPYFDNLNIVIGIYDATDESILKEADKALENFFKLDSKDRIRDSKLVLDYYKICEDYIPKPLKIENEKDIWNYVTPSIITVCESIVEISCECEWEIEHGLQLIFKDGKKLIRAGGHE